MNIEEIVFPPSDWVPNNQRFPVLIYKGALPAGGSCAAFEALFAANGWTGVWKDGVFNYQHYHSGARGIGYPTW
jgi:uncharacterized protein YjlB